MCSSSFSKQWIFGGFADCNNKLDLLCLELLVGKSETWEEFEDLANTHTHTPRQACTAAPERGNRWSVIWLLTDGPMADECWQHEDGDAMAPSASLKTSWEIIYFKSNCLKALQKKTVLLWAVNCSVWCFSLGLSRRPISLLPCGFLCTVPLMVHSLNLTKTQIRSDMDRSQSHGWI